MRRFIGLAAIVGMVFAGTAAAPVLTGNPHITISVVGTPTLGSTISFDVSRSAWVRDRCWQADVLVYEEWHPVDPAAAPVEFQQGPTLLWVEGSADCTAEARAPAERVRGSVDYFVQG